MFVIYTVGIAEKALIRKGTDASEHHGFDSEVRRKGHI